MSLSNDGGVSTGTNDMGVSNDMGISNGTNNVGVNKNQKSQNLFVGFLVGENKCGTDANGNPVKPSIFAWFWLLIMLLGLGGTILKLFRKRCHQNESRGKYVFLALIGIAVSVLNCWIFYEHLTKCSAWIGFFITLVISMAFSGVTYATMSAEC